MNQPPVGGGDARRWHPQHDGFQPSHQRGSEANPDQGTAGKQTQQTVRQAKDEGTCRRDEQTAALHPPRPEAIEQNAKRQLHDGHRQEIRAREQPQIAGAKSSVSLQGIGNQRVYAAEDSYPCDRICRAHRPALR